jgi:hypothetical protein
MLNITLPNGEVARLIRVVVESGELGAGTVHCTVVRDNWNFEDIPLDQLALEGGARDSEVFSGVEIG